MFDGEGHILNEINEREAIMNIAKSFTGLAMIGLIAAPVAAAKLGEKDRARVSRAAPKERSEVRYCLLKRKEGAKKGTIIGAAGGAATGAIAGGNLGETLLAGGAGALAGNLIGKGSGTNARCDAVLRRNP